MVASSCCSAWLRCSSGSLPGPAWPPTSESALGESSSNPGLQHLVYLNGTPRGIDVSSKASRAPMRFECLHVTCDHPAGQASKDGACFECRERPCELLIAVRVKAQRLDVCKRSPNLRAGCHSLAALRHEWSYEPADDGGSQRRDQRLSLIHISEPTRLGMISY